MNITLEELGSCRKKINIEIPVNEVDAALAETASKFATQANIPGFRPGRAPKDMVAKRYAKEIENETVSTLVNRGISTAGKEKNLKIVRVISVDDTKFQRGISMTFSSTMDVEPEFELPNYKGLPLPAAEVVTDETAVDQIMENFRAHQGSFEDVTGRPVEPADFVVMTFSTDCEGKPLTEIAPEARGLSGGTNAWISLADPSLPTGLREGMTGMNIGDKKEIQSHFPEDAVIEALRGKTATFSVEVTGIKTRNLPEWSDDLAKQLGSKFGCSTVSELREHIARGFAIQQKRQAEDNRITRALSQILEHLTFEIPASELEERTRECIQRIVRTNIDRGVTTETLEQKKGELYEQATAMAVIESRRDYALTRIADAEKIEATQEDLMKEIYFIAQQTQTPPEKVVEQIKKNDGIPMVAQTIRSRKAIQLILENSTAEATA